MKLKELNLNWGQLEPIRFNKIDHELTRRFIRELRTRGERQQIDVYVCSDSRNNGLRQILTHIPGVNILTSAGNAVYSPNERPSLVIAHGGMNQSGCGAVDYCRDLPEDEAPELPKIASRIKGDAIENASHQLSQVPEEWRAGILYYNHVDGSIKKIDGESYAKQSICNYIYDELEVCLKNRYSSTELSQMSNDQNPEIIFFGNFSTDITLVDLFRVNMQRNKFDGIIRDSLCFAMSNAMKSGGNFKNTQNTVMAFHNTLPVPNELNEVLNNEEFIKEYVERGGSIYLVSVGDLPSTKKMFRVVLN